MLNLPNFTPMVNGEAVIGWLFRLAKINAMDFNELIKLIDRQQSSSIPWFRHSYMYDVDFLSKLMNEDPYTFLTKRTNYLSIAPFLDLSKILMVYQLGFTCKFDYLNLLNKLKYKNITSFKVCPKCLKEKGTIMEIHQLPGIKVCNEHNVPLLYSVHNKKIMCRDIFDLQKYKLIGANDDDYLKSKFAYSIYESNIEMNSYQLHNFLLRNNVKDIMINGPESKINKLYKIFASPDNALNAINDYIANELPKTSIPKEYISVSPIRANLVEVIHNSCGTHFLTSPLLLNSGVGCPVCANKNPEMEVDRIISKKIPKYSRCHPLTDDCQNINIRHTCGAETKITIHDLINGHTPKCKCWNPADIEKINRIDGYKVIDYSKDCYQSRTATILHEKCNKSFEITTSAFLKDPYCRYCDEKRGIMNKINKIEKSGFDVLRYETAIDKNSAIIQCKKCGAKLIVPRNQFINNHECPYCNSSDKQSIIGDLKLLFSKEQNQLSTIDIEEKIDINHNTLNTYLSKLIKQGFIKKVSKGVYQCAK